MGFYNLGSRGTVSGPDEGDFDPEAACKKLNDGMKGLGTDENAIIEIIPKHTNEQRQEIKNKFKTMYGKDLTEALEAELGGSFAKVVLALLQEPEEFIIDCVHRSIEGLGTDEYSLIGLLCVRSNDDLVEMKTQYKEKHGKDMEEDIAEDLSGDLKSLIIGLINGGRDESEDIDEEKVKQDAKDLLDASSGAGTKEEVFAAIFNQRNASHMREVFDSYKEIADGKELEETIESEFSGNLQNAYLALIKIFRNVVAFHAERLRSAIKGAGTDDDAIIQILVTRSEIDLKDILEFYEGKYDSRLVDDLSADTSGDYRVIMQRILDESPTSDEGDGDAAGGAAEEPPTEVEEVTVESSEAPAEAEEAPVEAEEAPAESEEAPGESEDAPAESEAGEATEDTTAEVDEAPAEAEEAPVEAEEAPVEAEETPAETEEAPAETEEAAADGEAPAESEGAAEEVEETAVEADSTTETNAEPTANGEGDDADGEAEKEAEAAGDDTAAAENGDENAPENGDATATEDGEATATEDGEAAEKEDGEATATEDGEATAEAAEGEEAASEKEGTAEGESKEESDAVEDAEAPADEKEKSDSAKVNGK